MANICCSIEMEPRTLKEGQLNHAREEAADAVQKMEPNQASKIFVKGLREVNPVKEKDQMEENEHQQDHEEFVNCKEKAEIMLEIPCQCCVITCDECSDQLKLKEPQSAPF